MDGKEDVILDYLARKRENDERFVYRHLHGECYKLARELTGMFGGTVYMSCERDHATALIYGKMFDATGIIGTKSAETYHEMTEGEHAVAAKWKY